MRRVTGMITAHRACLFVLTLAAFHPSLLQAQTWHVGKYRGLVTGKSTSQDVTRVLGLPVWQGKPQEVPDEPHTEQWNYKVSTSQGQCCEVFLKNGIVDSITIETVDVSQREASKFFGDGFKPVRYRLGDDPADTGSAPICEDPNGSYTVLLNPQKGQALWVNVNGRVKEATYSATNPIHKCEPDSMKK